MLTRICLAALAVLALASAAPANIYSINTVAAGSQVVPPNGGTATGAFSGTYDDTTKSLSIVYTFSGLTGSSTACHLHGPGATGVNAPVLIGFAGFPTGVTSGTYSNTFVLTATQETILLGNTMYVCLHTTIYPGTEIRAQILPVPCIAISSQPVSVAGVTGGTAMFSVGVTGTMPIFQWRRNGVPLSNGSGFTGVGTQTLTITPLALSHNGAAYDCIVSNSCGSVRSNPAGLGVTQSCSADFNIDGVKNVADIFSYLSAWFAGCP